MRYIKMCFWFGFSMFCCLKVFDNSIPVVAQIFCALASLGAMHEFHTLKDEVNQNS